MSMGGEWMTDMERGYNMGCEDTRRRYEEKIERLRQIIADAPHAHNCDGSTNGILRYPEACDCWKSRVGKGEV